jgi:DNA-binding transcriptional regulator YiaG
VRQKGQQALPAHKRESRLAQGAQLRSMYRLLGHDRRSVAKFLRVTPRTIYSWETARAAIPCATLKLLRLLVRAELPGKDWQGWSFSRGTLWSPEGHGFKASDFSWLSLTIRQARMFRAAYRDRSILRQALQAAMAEAAEARIAAATARSHAGLLDLAERGGLAGADDSSVLVHLSRAGHRAAGGAAAAARCADGRGVLVTPPGRLTGETARALAGVAA